jgi:CubicO group peptidase (beta-lactamase class C family)
VNFGGLNSAQLQTTVANLLGLSVAFTYDSPQLAAGVKTTADEYAFFLRKILNNQLAMSALLGFNKVCTSPNAADSTCPTDPNATPITSTEKWHYSIGHWVEDDPTVGDGAFSSPGAFGFYPWIDKDKAYYGIIARYSFVTTNDSVAEDSVGCGRLIRKAWLTGKEQ